MNRSTMCLLAAASIAAAAPSQAAVMGTLTGGTAFTNGGSLNVIRAPAAVGDDNFNNNNVRVFAEQQNIRLSEALSTDPGARSIAAGTVVNSFYVNFDPLNEQTASGTITFDTQILGLIFSRADLRDSDFLGATGTEYLNPGKRGFENDDSASFSGRVVTFSLVASSPGDSFRVITAGVPEPATWAMMMIGFAMVGAAARYRNKATRVTFA